MPTKHILYYGTYSICSIMVRYAFALRGKAKDPEHEITIEGMVINLATGEQLTEHYLCDVNPYGEVPTIVPPNAAPIPDSVAITKHLAQSYPSLIPQEHAAEIDRLLAELHKISFFSLAFAGKAHIIEGQIAALQEKAKTDISDRYRKAIEHKIERSKKTKLAELTADSPRHNEEHVRTFAKEVDQLLECSRTDWLLGTERPTAIDAHLVTMVARLTDIDRLDLLSGTSKLEAYGAKARKTPEWEEVMQGRKTKPPV